MFVGCLAVLIAATGFLTEVPPRLKAKLTATNAVNGAFVQRKLTPEGREYVMKGTYAIRPGVDFTWRTQEPFATTFYATPTNYVYSNEDETVMRPLAELPGFGDFAVFARGDFSRFFTLFDALYQEDGEKFFLRAKPKVTDLKRVLRQLDAEGTLTNWTLKAEFPDRTRFTLEFTDRN